MHCIDANDTLLVLGGSGLLGRAVCAAFRETCRMRSPGRADLDVHDADGVHEFIRDLRPRVVVNCTGKGGHDACETDPAGAWEENATAVRHIATACASCGATLIQISSAAVFDGTKTAPYLETDLPAPVNSYGASKLAGEAIARAVAPVAYIFRLPMLYGEPEKDSTSFIARLHARLVDTSTKEVRLADDEQTCPTPAAAVAAAILRTLGELPPGTYHLACSGSVSLYEIGRFMAEALRCKPQLVPVPAATFAHPCMKPLQGSLHSVFLPSLGPWQKHLTGWLAQHCKAQWT